MTSQESLGHEVFATDATAESDVIIDAVNFLAVQLVVHPEMEACSEHVTSIERQHGRRTSGSSSVCDAHDKHMRMYLHVYV